MARYYDVLISDLVAGAAAEVGLSFTSGQVVKASFSTA